VGAIQAMLEEGGSSLKVYGQGPHKYYSDCLSLKSGVDQFVMFFVEIAKK